MVTYHVFRFFSRLLRIVSIVAVVFLAAGLIGFLTDQVRNSSEVSATRISLVQGGNQVVTVDITQPDPPAYVEQLREKQHTKAREVIDDVNDVLFRPFTWIAQERAVWVQRLIYTGLAFLVYGVLLMILANQLRLMGEASRREVISEAEARAAQERRESGTFVSPA